MSIEDPDFGNRFQDYPYDMGIAKRRRARRTQ